MLAALCLSAQSQTTILCRFRNLILDADNEGNVFHDIKLDGGLMIKYDAFASGCLANKCRNKRILRLPRFSSKNNLPFPESNSYSKLGFCSLTLRNSLPSLYFVLDKFWFIFFAENIVFLSLISHNLSFVFLKGSVATIRTCESSSLYDKSEASR